MKIKDLLKFNPEADIEIIMPNNLAYEGELTYGWSNTNKDLDNTQENATEVCIILGETSEIES